MLLRTYEQGSHGGVSGRYRRYEQTAFIDAFLLDLAGIGGPELRSSGLSNGRYRVQHGK
jgi:hypothetical protein